jgi:rare lipoprotein A
MRGVSGVFPRVSRPSRSIHPTTCVAALTVAAVLVAVALYVGEQAAVYLPDKIAITSWQPPSAAHDLAEPEPSQTSNREKKAAREPVRMEARLVPQAAEPKPAETNTAEPKDDASGADAGALPETGRASWYDLDAKTASGEDMDGDGLTAAHPTLPLGSHVRVENLDNGRTIVVRINDRGPFAKDRIIDVSKAAAAKLGMIAAGVANVRVSPVAGQVATNVKAGGA